MIFNRNFTESDIDFITIRCQLEHQIQKQETKDSGSVYHQNNSNTTYFYETTKKNEWNYVKSLLRSSTILIFENDDKYCFFCLILASVHLCKNNQPKRVF